MAELFGATVAMAFTSMLIGWIVRKLSSTGVFASRLVGLAIMLFIAPPIYIFASGGPYFQAFLAYSLGALLAGAIFYCLRQKEKDA